MGKIRLTKNEHKKQKDQLRMFTRYLPMLQLKKQQLQMEIQGVERLLLQLEEKLQQMETRVQPWLALFADASVPLETLLEIRQLQVGVGNIAGVEIPVFQGLQVVLHPYDFFSTPFWIDQGLSVVYQRISLLAEVEVVREQKRRLERELRVTTQRVNLFEKVKIPDIKASIKKIAIYLGDQQTAAVVRGKISKKKLGGVT